MTFMPFNDNSVRIYLKNERIVTANRKTNALAHDFILIVTDQLYINGAKLFLRLRLWN